jgi:tetratricopeptide (TPR) repeat protein
MGREISGPARTFGPASLAAVVIAAVGVYFNTLGHGFVWDDHLLVETNEFLHKPANARVLFSAEAFRTPLPIQAAARPVLLLSLLGDRAAWKDKSRGYHLTNVLLHAGASAAFGALTAASGVAPALAAGLIFAVHPVNSEAVNLVSFRADVLAALFGFLSLFTYLRARRGLGLGRWAWLGGSVFLYGAAVLSKEMAVTVPVLAVLWELSLGRREARAWAVWGAAAILFSVTAVFYIGFRSARADYKSIGGSPVLETLAQDKTALASVETEAPAKVPPKSEAERIDVVDPSAPPWQRIYEDDQANLRVMGVVVARYLGLMLWPRDLRADRSPRLFDYWTEPPVLLSWGLLAALAALGVLTVWKGASWGWILGWWFVSLLPVSNIVPIYNPMAERYLYFVVPAVAWAAALALERLPRIPRTAVLVLLILGLGARTLDRNPDWVNDEALYQAEMRRGSPSARVLYNLALLRHKQLKLEEARGLYEQALVLHPEYLEATANLAAVMDGLGRKKESLRLLEKATRLAPGSGLSYAVLGRAYDSAGQTKKALEAYGHALRRDPRMTATRLRRAEILADMGKDVDAAKEHMEIARLDPTAAASSRYIAAMLLKRAGQNRWALEELEKVLVLKPDHFEANVEASVINQELGRLAPAEKLMRKALEINPKSPEVHYGLAHVMLAQARYSEAAAIFEDLRDADPDRVMLIYDLGAVYQKMGDFAAAERSYREFLRRRETLEALSNLADMMEQSERLDEAELLAKRAILLFPAHRIPLTILGNVYFKQNRIELALENYMKAVDASHVAAEGKQARVILHASIGACLRRLGRFEEAEEYLRVVLEVRPGYGPALRGLEAIKEELEQ